MKIPALNLKKQYTELKSEIDSAVQRVLDSGYFCLGSELKAFEQEFADYIGVKYAIGVASGSAALNLSVLALGIGAGDEVVVPVNTYIATAFSVTHVGAKVKFIDNNKYYNIDTDKIEEKISKNVAAVIPVHLYGQPANIEKILKLKRKYGFFIIEDMAQSVGAMYKGAKTGSLCDVACVSFYPGKNLGAFGDGGAILTNSEKIRDKVLELRNDGRRKDKYVHYSIGWNERLDDIQAAILRVKLKHLDEWNNKRVLIADRYRQLISDKRLPVVLPEIAPDCKTVYHQFVIRVAKRNQILDYLRDKGVGVGIHYPIPLHKQPCYKDLESEDYPVAEEFSEQLLSLPIDPYLTDEQVEQVVFLLGDAIEYLKR